MGQMNFTEEDKQKLVDFLNMTAKNAKFTLDTNEIISYFRLLAHVQQKIVPKIDSHILELKRVIEAKDKLE